MPELEASRTLVKSTPELWAECSDAASLARHLGAFGEIRITRLEPETAVAWEGDEVRGTVTLEPSGWGTRVVLTAVAGSVDDDPLESPPPAVEAPPSEAEVEAEAEVEEDETRSALPLLAPTVAADPPVPSPSYAEPAPLPEPTLLMRILSRLGVRVQAPRPVSAEREDLTVEREDQSVEREDLSVEREDLSVEREDLTVEREDLTVDSESLPEPAPDPVAVEEPVAEEAQPEANDEPEASEPELDALISALDSLGTPRRRPFSRA